MDPGVGSESTDKEGPPDKRRRLDDKTGSPESKSSSSGSVGTCDIKPGDFADYQKKQRQLARGQAPGAGSDFQKLFRHPGRYAFVDNSLFILEICDAYLEEGKAILIRPRRFGKSTFGQLWLEFFRGNKELFADLEMPNEKIPEPGTYVCVHLDLSGANPATFAKTSF